MMDIISYMIISFIGGMLFATLNIIYMKRIKYGVFGRQCYNLECKERIVKRDNKENG